jgi:CRP-like cAMP-binding protein
LLAALSAKPEIALLLIDTLAKRLQHSFQRATKQGLSVPEPLVNVAKLPPGAVDCLRKLLDDPVPARADAGGTLITKDGKGLFMYILIDGKVAISVNDQVVEYAGPESVFGELALLNSASRAASAVAVEASSWLPIGREDFLRVVGADPRLGFALLRSMSDRVRFAGFLLSETPAVLRALNAPRLNAAAAGKILGSVRMLYNRAATAFLSEARAGLSALTQSLQENQRAEPLRLIRELQQMANKIGAERFAFQAAVLEGIIESAEQIGRDAQLAVLMDEFQDTEEEIGDYLKRD